MITVIVPIYNVSQYLEFCIESICSQTYTNLEIILVDDGSTDRSPAICDEFAAQDSRIVVIHKVNGGLVSARKRGLKAAKGDYIVYVDGDDWIEPCMLEVLHKCMEDNSIDIAMCGWLEDTAADSKKGNHSFPEGKYDKTALRYQVYPHMIHDGTFWGWGIFPSVCGKIFRKEGLYSSQMKVDDRLTMGEDAACTYPCLLHANCIYVKEACLYHYRQTPGSMIKCVPNSDVEQRQFQILYQSVMQNLSMEKHIYDLRPQWEEYVLFLMASRADGLYKKYSELEFLFPFPDVKKDMKIVIYGAGTYGQRLYKYLQDTGFCEIVLWADRNYNELQKLGLEVESPELMKEKSYDKIVIAMTYYKPRIAVYKELLQRYGGQKVSMIDVERIRSEESRRAFGLVEWKAGYE